MSDTLPLTCVEMQFHWTCPHCGSENSEWKVEEVVICIYCDHLSKVQEHEGRNDG